jgi:hypothetical protein
MLSLVGTEVKLVWPTLNKYMTNRDKLGKFLPGNTVNSGRTDRTAVIPHPLYKDRDTYGRRLAKNSIPELEEVRQFLLAALTEEDVLLMKKQLFKLMKDKDNKIALGALSLAYSYFMGKPSQKVEVQKASVTMTKEQVDEMMKAASLT